MTKKVLYIDMDGVIADFEGGFDLLDPAVLKECAALFAETNPRGETLHFGGADFPDWGAVLDYLRDRAQVSPVAR